MASKARRRQVGHPAKNGSIRQRLADTRRHSQTVRINDYLTWIVLGLAATGGTLALIVR
jgi:hypothetical protein